ncbi:hypothetical protein [Rhodohalobacter mucosus]|uniref:Quinol:cytochrome c oxidoreductase quinone-binding subunit 2 n=1 Tax=Rhodohalobacter mucosus TaxID=2079485 RepID=A0A316TXI9_9BACT|nr:hypothetical protein [Rhodohalobacter mucosus]PWN07344.1 hypothetical protein DDZ15_03505 [Rhodohalobacter mucosus]
MASSSPTLTDSVQFPAQMDVAKTFYGIGIVGLIASSFGFFLNSKQFFYSYLTSFTFFTSIALASLILVMIHHVTKSSWGTVMRRIPESFLANIGIWSVFMIPILLGMTSLYKWTSTEYVMNDPIMVGKIPYLNEPFFVIRQFIYFGIWGFLGHKLHKISVEMDRTNDWGLTVLLRKFSAPGILIFAITVAFASFDWLMSLDAHWFSTMFGVYFFAMSFQALFPVIILMVLWMQKKGILNNTIGQAHIYDLGAWLFGFTVFYAYIAFSQFLLIYYANIPEETLWYYHRLEGSWAFITYGLLIGRFILPFILLLNREPKHNKKLLTFVSILIITMHLIELHWIVMPVIHYHGFTLSWLDVTTFIGLGGIFMGLFFHKFRSHNMVPVNDPQLSESLNKHYHH